MGAADPQKMEGGRPQNLIYRSRHALNTTGVGVNDSHDTASVHERWARFRFGIIGSLLAAPPGKGELHAALDALAKRTWKHPITGEEITFGVSTIERWFYRARNALGDPGSLRRKVRNDLGVQHSVSEFVASALREQHSQFKSWSVHLHYRNLEVLGKEARRQDEIPSYSTVRRFFRAQGLRRRRSLGTRRTEGIERAEQRLEKREVRGWEVEHVNGVWQYDGHYGSRQVVTPRGEYVTPVLIGVLDNRSRLAAHLQWYYGDERAEIIAHSLSQGFMKRGLPASAYRDNGSGMRSEEVQEGLRRLGVVDAHTLPRSAYMNGKIENFWKSVETQLMPMLERVSNLTLDGLNESTHAWYEYDYNRIIHSETRQTPMDRFLAGPHVSRLEPDEAGLRLAFTRSERRTQRFSDGTIVIKGRRFEVPNCYRHMNRLVVRYAAWDLSYVHLVDERTSEVLCRINPQDKVANARGVRRPLEPVMSRTSLRSDPGVPPLLRSLLNKQADTGLPPPYKPLYTSGEVVVVNPGHEIDKSLSDEENQSQDDGE
jgi:transposase InsO family protein